MAIQQAPPSQALDSHNLVDILERILDKGLVIAGDIRINLVNVELLTIQLRLVICSVDKAKEMGMDWWVNNPVFTGNVGHSSAIEDSLNRIAQRLDKLEGMPEQLPETTNIKTEAKDNKDTKA